jgi:outer membrane receptor protein involved in Fe transport
VWPRRAIRSPAPRPTPGRGFASEEITSFELGAKLDLLDNRVRLNMALFKQIYENYQFTRIIVPAGTSIVVRGVDNTDADISGGEVELTALLPADITAAITYGHTNADIDGGDYDGEPLPGIPESDYSFNLSKPVPMGAGELDLMLNYSWKDSHFSELDAQDASGIDDIGLLNLSATHSQDNRTVAGFVNNATDEDYLTVTTYAFGCALNFAGVGMPRVAGCAPPITSDGAPAGAVLNPQRRQADSPATGNIRSADSLPAPYLFRAARILLTVPRRLLQGFLSLANLRNSLLLRFLCRSSAAFTPQHKQ